MENNFDTNMLSGHRWASITLLSGLTTFIMDNLETIVQAAGGIATVVTAFFAVRNYIIAYKVKKQQYEINKETIKKLKE